METKSARVGWIDEVRGLAVWAMILYHIAFNITEFLELPVPWLRNIMESRVLGVLHTVFVAIFLGLSGVCCHFTRHPFWRAGKVLLCAGAVTAVTVLVFPDATIWFGILHCLAVCMLLYALLQKYLSKIPTAWGLLGSVLLFFLTMRLPDGFVFSCALPSAWYRGGFWTVLGFPDRFFTSLDYVPLLPHLFLFSAGVFLGAMDLPKTAARFRFLAFCGRHSLVIYLVHQPLVFGMFLLLEKILKG